MPLEASSFPEDVQVAFFVLDLLSDRWEGSSGMYLGKDWSPINFILDLYEVDNKKTVIYFAKMYENMVVNHRAEELSRKQKEAERRAKSGTRVN